MKQELLEALAETRQREADLGALVTEEPPDPSGRWRVQDHLSHLAWLREREARVIDAVRTGGDIPPDTGGDLSALIYEATHGETASTVIANSQRSWDLLQAAIEGCSEEDFSRPHPLREGRKLVDESPADHVGAHLMWAYLDAGDEKAAEAVQLWARDLSNRMFDDPRSRGVASYNVGCFYARVRRAGEAVPMLREGMELLPQLKEWAKQDPDLDPIRDDPRVIQLLA
ncbi:MAG TPA: hypothetical protein VGX27_09320 [Candidatus Dormibacteraeota bacterium]|nr:hypothetical protein [Candidatus Dormibacteraeota bacterium]